MSGPGTGGARRTGFPTSVVVAFAGCGILGGLALIGWLSWLAAFGYERGWSTRPESFDGSGVPLLLALVLTAPAVGLGVVGYRRGRRRYGWSGLATGLVGLGSALGAAIVIGFAASVR